ncbi:N-acetylmuramoyl-L-alanine amidase [Escherichia coli]|uniref:N-acetylmuramoyl-L-alanine amidase n=1 Tax=Escherichia coli TaxID=562 RepID=A0A2X1KHH0_ECOLX|nr:N-acetylmuramoyl-L-alanine amidase [Escherichia coli]
MGQVAQWRNTCLNAKNRADEVAGKKATDKDHLLQQVLFDLVQTDTIKNSLTLGLAYSEKD